MWLAHLLDEVIHQEIFCTLIDSNSAQGREFWTYRPVHCPELLDLCKGDRFYKWLRRDVKHIGFSEGSVSAYVACTLV